MGSKPELLAMPTFAVSFAIVGKNLIFKFIFDFEKGATWAEWFRKSNSWLHLNFHVLPSGPQGFQDHRQSLWRNSSIGL